MARVTFPLESRQPMVAGSFGSPADLKSGTLAMLTDACDIAEIRLDLLAAAGGGTGPTAWRHLEGFPLLFTARRIDEGAALDLGPAARAELLRGALRDAAWVDIEVASIGEMAGLIEELAQANIPWLASYHDFGKLPTTAALEQAANRALAAGASVFKAAARLESPEDLARLADFQLADHGLPVATMGMGPLAPVSRLLAAQCGSVLNYGYLGATPTAPGQWDAALLKKAIARLTPLSR